MEQIVKELHVQLTRIAQIQAQLDRIGQPTPTDKERRREGDGRSES